ncbi:MAG: AbrB/MazE/SpoVT family DNA-binding domain-containing protein [Alphaproteobacteria bacterium]|nr:AbrB/MazE/SpoVT family DNA-binding domain-containing protein [Alphaproteobacteria bacterium]MCB9931143.1 AbrB/MazE/SpoVT family DNA-binding domain-containing protein [Alphaproteobacteria bacterium]
MHKLKLTTVGSSTGAVFPKELLAKLNVAKGDHLYLVETPSGYLITPYDPEVAEQTGVAFDFMNEYRDTLRALAK